MRLGITDLVTSSNFPALAALELGFFNGEGLKISLEQFPSPYEAYEALKGEKIEFLAASAHTAPASFSNWKGLKLLCTQAQGMHLVLTLHKRYGAKAGDIGAINGRLIGTAPWDAAALNGVLRQCNVDAQAISIRTITPAAGRSFSLSAQEALADGSVDGIWADGITASIAVAAGYGALLFDVRRGHGSRESFNCTSPAISSTERFVEKSPGAVAAFVRAITKTQKELRANPRLAHEICRRILPKQSDFMIDAIKMDSLFYDAALSRKFIAGMTKFAVAVGGATQEPPYETIVATQLIPFWGGSNSRSARQNRTGSFGE